MDELAKTEARNYLSAAGFFVFGAVEFIWLIALFSGTMAGFSSVIDIAAGIGMLIIAALLIILRKRDMISLLFVMLAFLLLLWTQAPDKIPGMVTCAFALLVTIVTLTSKDKQKWFVFALPLLLLIGHLFLPNIIAVGISYSIAVLLSIYYAFACASERIVFPGKKLLTADELTDFKYSGSVLGYILFALISGSYTTYYIVGEAVLSLDLLVIIELIAAGLMIYVAILLFAVGKMRFTPVMFLLIGLIDIMAMYSSGTMYIGLGILFIILGAFAILRKESRILPGIMLIIYGCTDFFTIYAGGNMPAVSAVLNVIPCIIAVYLAFVVYSQRKLPKF